MPTSLSPEKWKTILSHLQPHQFRTASTRDEVEAADEMPAVAQIRRSVHLSATNARQEISLYQR